MRATCPIYFIPLNSLTRIIFDEAYKLWSSSLCSLLQPPATSSLLDPNILIDAFNALIQNTQIALKSINVLSYAPAEIMHLYKTNK
jgi:hypothetical protein